MKYKSLTYKDKKYNKKSIIEDILISNDFHWLINAEFEDAIITLKNNTIIWEDGVWFYGIWHYGIWKKGTWYDGIFKNGIFESGDRKNGTFEKVIDNKGKLIK